MENNKDNKSDPEQLERNAAEFDNCLDEYTRILAEMCTPANQSQR